MTTRIVVAISGPVASGKSSLARALESRFGGTRFSTRELLIRRAALKGEPSRRELQEAGTKLDVETAGTWVADGLSELIYASASPLCIVDSVRIAEQVDGLRRAFGRDVRHVHVTASESTCEARFAQRKELATFSEPDSYAEVISDRTEAQVDSLGRLADVQVDTDRNGDNDVLVRVAARLGLLDTTNAPCVDVVVGGQYGSEGKGNIAFYLAPEYDLLVRVGGPNAAHKVHLPAEGQVFTHFSLPSGTQAGQAKLAIGPGAVIDIETLLDEISRSDVTIQRLSIDPAAAIIEDSDKAAEADLKVAIGSTQSGSGHTTSRRVMRDKGLRFAKDIEELKPYLCPLYDVLERAYSRGNRVMLEGTQGSGLSLYHGPYPKVTSRDTNVAGCLAEAGISPSRVRKVVLVVRSYPIRVAGPSGPLRAELAWEDIEKRSGQEGLKSKELTSKTHNLRRVGEFEWDLVRRAAILNGPTDIALTFADYVHVANRDAWRFEQLSEETIRFIDELERVTGARVSLISTGFMPFRGVIDRRQWT